MLSYEIVPPKKLNFFFLHYINIGVYLIFHPFSTGYTKCHIRDYNSKYFKFILLSLNYFNVYKMYVILLSLNLPCLEIMCIALNFFTAKRKSYFTHYVSFVFMLTCLLIQICLNAR